VSAEIRFYEPGDREQMLAMHKRRSEADGVRYLFADPDDPVQFGTLVAVDEEHVVASVGGRKTVEGIVLVDPEYGRGREGPRKRWDALREMLAQAAVVCYREGYREVHAALPPWQERGYGRRLVNDLGYHRDLRVWFYLDLNAVFSGRKP
jgi:hypothetical protein